MSRFRFILPGLVVVATACWGIVGHTYVTSAKWSSTNVAFFINPQNADLDAAAAEAALKAGMDVWNTQAGSSFRYVYGGRVNDSNTGYDGKNVILFRNSSNGAALATTYSWFSGGTMMDADIVFWDATYRFFSGVDGCDGGAYVEDVAAHELGHALGLKHSTVADATMYASVSFCSQELRTLAADDIAGAQALYGRGGESSTNTAPSVMIISPTSNSVFDATSTVSFAGSATDSQDGSLTAALTWTSSLDGLIGSGGTFSRGLSPGTHVITARAVDGAGLAGSKQVTVNVAHATEVATHDAPVLTARAYREKNAKKVDLSWSGFTAGSVDVYRNGAKVQTTANDGFQTDSIKGSASSFQYKLCGAGTETCSATITVVF